MSVGRAAPSAEALADTTLASLHARLSEPSGFFDTDNLISNETSYLHVLGPLWAMSVRGGAYIGVGPDQSFSYMAAIRPTVAFIVDIRRDNTLQHLLFKALFELAGTRLEYLSLLLGRTAPESPEIWHENAIAELVDYIDALGPDPSAARLARIRVDSAVVTFGFELSERDLATIGRFHQTFITAGPSLRFTSLGRPPRWYYPTFRGLLLETDLTGRTSNYLAHREDYLFLRDLQMRDLVIPVVGDLAGEHALRAVGEEVRARGETVSVIYTSNVEFYLVGNGTFDRFAANIATLPRDSASVLIRSYFPNQGTHPHAVPGHYSTQSLQTLDSFVASTEAGGYRSYWSLVTENAIDPRPVGVGN